MTVPLKYYKIFQLTNHVWKRLLIILRQGGFTRVNNILKVSSNNKLYNMYINI